MTTLGNSQKHRDPTGYKVAPQSYDTLEAAAISLSPFLPREGRKVIGWRVLERMLPKANYQPHIAEVAELREVAAFTIPDQGLVVIRRDVYDGLFTGSVFARSTVIHELCHIVLKHHVTLHRGAIAGKHEFFEDSEWQAKSMTAAVMMPLDACREAAGAADLADICGTSIESATYRLDRLRKKGLILKQGGLF
jgi:hypothetical protein